VAASSEPTGPASEAGGVEEYRDDGEDGEQFGGSRRHGDLAIFGAGGVTLPPPRAIPFR
jgi:hypothetical protein